jgi:hypothetical protein
MTPLWLWALLPVVDQPLRIERAHADAQVTVWGEDCGPRPGPGALPRGGVHHLDATGRVVEASGDVLFGPGLCRRLTQQPEIVERAASSTRFVCTMPPGSARDIQGTIEVQPDAPGASNAAALEVVSDLRYRWSLKGSTCDVRLVERRRLVAEAPAAPAEPPSAASCATVGEPVRLEVVGSPRLATRSGGRVRLEARLLDARGCRVERGLSFVTTHGRIDATGGLELLTTPPGTRVRAQATLAGLAAVTAEWTIEVARDTADLERLLAALPTPSDTPGLAVRPQSGESTVSLDTSTSNPGAPTGSVLGARVLLVSFLAALALSATLGVLIVLRTLRTRRAAEVLNPEAERVLERSLATKRVQADARLCPRCGRRYPDDAEFCGDDGAPLQRVN